MNNNLICKQCGKQSPDVVVRFDPYALELQGEKKPMALCPECYQARADEI